MKWLPTRAGLKRALRIAVRALVWFMILDSLCFSFYLLLTDDDLNVIVAIYTGVNLLIFHLVSIVALEFVL